MTYTDTHTDIQDSDADNQGGLLGVCDILLGTQGMYSSCALLRRTATAAWSCFMQNRDSVETDAAGCHVMLCLTWTMVAPCFASPACQLISLLLPFGIAWTTICTCRFGA